MGSGRIDAEGRIHWWRLYQFPPIVSPCVAGVTSSASESNQQPSNSINIVVPVIVVGLQSVRPLAGGDYDGNEMGFHDGHRHRHRHGAHSAHTHAANTQRGVDTSEPPPSFASGTESAEDEDFDASGNQSNERPHHHYHCYCWWGLS